MVPVHPSVPSALPPILALTGPSLGFLRCTCYALPAHTRNAVGECYNVFLIIEKINWEAGWSIQ